MSAQTATQSRPMVVCKRCGGTERTADGRRCKPCRESDNARYQKTYYEKNKPARHANVATYYAKNKDKNRAKTNADYARNKGRRLATKRKWRQANPDKVYLYVVKRKASRKGATPSWANEFFIAEAYALAKLRTQMLGGPWEVDHIVPLQSDIVCGLHVEHNLRVIPRSVNRKKSNSHWPDMP